MSRKREDDNLQLFEELKLLMSWLKPEVVLEFEAAIGNAVRTIVPS